MGTVIYSVSPMQAFMGQFVTALIMLAIGILGLATSFIREGGRRKPITLSRIVLGLAGGFLVLTAGVLAFLTYREFKGEVKTVTVLVDDKQVVESNCNDGDTCISYLIETSAPPKAYDFTVDREAYEKLQVRACYEFTYYPEHGLLAPAYDTNYYEAASAITSIIVADASACGQH